MLRKLNFIWRKQVMKNIMKKMLSVITVVCICLSFSVIAFAADGECEEKVPLGECAGMCDIDGDGFISSCDARTALRAAVGLDELTDKETVAADYDEDGKVTSYDARMILRTAVELEDVPAHRLSDSVWAKDKKCEVCDEVVEIAKMAQVVAAANEWAADMGVDGLVKGTSEDGKAGIEINVDGIWADVEIEADAFDGFLTALGAAINEYFGEASVTVDGKEVFKDGKLQNTAVKNALFDIGAGFFYKIANLGDDGVYGVYALVIDGEEIELTVKFTGTEDNLGKVKSFAQTISEHISAEVVDGNLVIDVYAPDALKNVIIETAGEDAKTKLDALTIRKGLGIVCNLDADEVFGSQETAVNKLCAVICQLTPFVNKVLDKTVATVTVDGGEVALTEGEFAPSSADFGGLVYGVSELLSEELLDTTVGAFAVEGEEYYSVKVNLSVDMSSLGLMAGETIEETVIINIHVFDN